MSRKPIPKMTPRERMLAAYRNQIPDRVPVSPEIWTATVIDHTGLPFHRLSGPFADVDYIKAWYDTQEYFGFDAWILAEFEQADEGDSYSIERSSSFVDDNTIETINVIKTKEGDLRSVSRTNDMYDGWMREHPVKVFERDFPAYMEYTMCEAGQLDTGQITHALKVVGEGGLVSVNLGELFISYIAYGREGDIGQTLLDIYDHERFLLDVRGRYTDYLCARIDLAAKVPGLESVFINCGYSDGGVLGPETYSYWEIPLLKSIADHAGRYGLPLHLHQHGRCRRIVPLVAQTGVSVIDSLEAPSANGDVEDLAELKKETEGKIALKGNIDPNNILKNGTLKQIEDAVKECIDKAGAGGGYILSTGDSALMGTPEDHLFLLSETGQKYGDIYRSAARLETEREK